MRDVIIIGGGVVGLSCAYHLQQKGLRVTILDKGNMSDGCSYGNAGMIVPSHFIPLASPGVISKGLKWMLKKNSPFYIKPRLNWELAQWLWTFYRSGTKKHVDESMALLRDMHVESREWYKQLNQHASFDFGFEQKGILMLFKSKAAERDEIKMAEIAHQIGIEANQLTAEQLKQIEPGIDFSVAGAIHYPGDAHLNPSLFMLQMVQYLKASGVEILTRQHVIHLEDKESDGGIVYLADGRQEMARHIVVASGIWSSGLLKKSGEPLLMQDGKGYSMNYTGVKKMPTIPSILHEARVALTPMGEQLRVAGTLEISGMDDRISAEKVKSIIESVPEYYPGISMHQEAPVWSGYRPCSPDGLPYIGRFKSKSAILMAAGHAMMGLSLAPVTGRMVADEIIGKNQSAIHPKLFPGRFS